MPTKAELMAKIETLEADARRRDRELRRLRNEHDKTMALVDSMREQLVANDEQFEQWKEAFNMWRGDDGVWYFTDDVRDSVAWIDELLADWNKLVRQWNRHVATIDASEPGRPLAASEAQVAVVEKLRNGGVSLRGIARETGLGLQTVRTIIERASGTDRTTKRREVRHRREVDRLRMADWRARRRAIEGLPKRITKAQRDTRDLIKAAKGLGEPN